MSIITVIKLNHLGLETYRYQARLIAINQEKIVLEAFFDRDRTQVGKIVLNRGDRFVETYFTDRWYNIFEIFHREDNHIKCWYCNVTTPAVLEDNRLFYKDLALDLLVYQDGQQEVLDEEEFKNLPLDTDTRYKAQQALNELQELFLQKVQKDRYGHKNILR